MSDNNLDLERPWSEFEWENVLREREEAVSDTLTNFDDADDVNDYLEELISDMEDDEDDEDEMDDEDKTEDVELLAKEFVHTAICSSEEINAGFNLNSDPHYQKADKIVIELLNLPLIISENTFQKKLESLLIAGMASRNYLAAAIASFGSGEPGMTLAYLKRSISELHMALDALSLLRAEPGFGTRRAATFREMFLSLREGLVDMLSESRREWIQISRPSE